MFLRHQTRTVSRISFRNPGVGKSSPSRGPAAGGTPDGLRRCTRGQPHRGLQCVGRAVVTLVCHPGYRGASGDAVSGQRKRVCRPVACGAAPPPAPTAGGSSAAGARGGAVSQAVAGRPRHLRDRLHTRRRLGWRSGPRLVAAHVEGARPFGALSQLHAVGTVSGQCSEAGPCR